MDSKLVADQVEQWLLYVDTQEFMRQLTAFEVTLKGTEQTEIVHADFFYPESNWIMFIVIDENADPGMEGERVAGFPTSNVVKIVKKDIDNTGTMNMDDM